MAAAIPTHIPTRTDVDGTTFVNTDLLLREARESAEVVEKVICSKSSTRSYSRARTIFELALENLEAYGALDGEMSENALRQELDSLRATAEHQSCTDCG